MKKILHSFGKSLVNYYFAEILTAWFCCRILGFLDLKKWLLAHGVPKSEVYQSLFADGSRFVVG